MNAREKITLVVLVLGSFLAVIFFLLFLINKKIAIVFILAIFAYILADKHRPIVLNKQDLYSSKVSETYKIVQITDFHSGSFKRAQQIVKLVREIKPDIVCLTGDIWEYARPVVHHTSVDMLLAELSKDFPTYIVNGNHDYKFLPSDKLHRVIFYPENGEYGFEVLQNPLDLGDISLSGVGIRSKSNLDLKPDSDKINIVLTHYPTMAEEIIKNDAYVGLVLAGDTHGGQVRLPFFGAIFAFRMKLFPELRDKYRGLVRGLVKIDTDRGKRTQPTEGWLDSGQFIYVCSGAGYNGDSIRFLCPAQISLINIHPSK